MAGTTRGARSLGEGKDRRKRGGWLKWLVLALLLIGAAIVLASLLGGDDEKASKAPATQAQEAAPSGGAQAGAGSLTAGRQSLLPPPGQLPNGTLGERAQGREVTIQEVNPNEGFWVGTSATDRVYVEYGGAVGEDESGAQTYEPKVGEKVDLTGEVRPSPREPEQTLNLRKPDDAALVKEQGFFINAEDVQPVR